jgi:hypothetical protein
LATAGSQPGDRGFRCQLEQLRRKPAKCFPLYQMCLKEIEIRATKKTLRHVLKVIILVFAWMPKAS